MNNKTIKTPIEDIFAKRFGRYSKYIIQERALPDIRDGLKPVQRRILYAMYKDNNIFEKQFRKSAKTVGNVIGNYHPHGDSSVYEAMVRMSQDWKVNSRLVIMHGNNGSIDGDNPAAMRYTEAKLSAYSSFLLQDIDKGTVKMNPNFDDTELEPSVLPTLVPNLLINGTQGIASGYATEIPPHNIEEVLKAAIYFNQHEEATLNDLMKYIKAPDFPTGGIIQGKENIKKAYETGRGKIVISSKYEIIKNDIFVKEIPYDVNKSVLLQRIEMLKIEKKVEGIAEVVDQSDRNGLEIRISCLKNSNPQIIMNYLLKNTDLQRNYSLNMIAISNKKPTLMGIREILSAFLMHRKDVITNRSKYLLTRAKTRLEIVEGLIIAIDNLDKVVKIIRASEDKKSAKLNLEKEFKLNERQSEAIVIMPLYKLTATDIKDLQAEYDKLQETIAKLTEILNNKEVLKNVIDSELKEVLKNNKCPRKSIIQDEVDEIIINKADLIKEETNILLLTENKYIKRTNLRSYLTAKTIPQLIQEDKLQIIKKIKNKSDLLIFFDDGSYALVPAYEIEETKWKDMGKNLVTLVKNIEKNKIVNVFTYEKDKKVMSITENGYLSIVNIEEFITKKIKKQVKYQKLKPEDKVVSVDLVNSNSDVIVVTDDDKYQLFNTQEFEENQIKRVGSKIKSLNKKQNILHISEIKENILLMSENGYYSFIKKEQLNKENYRFDKLYENLKTPLKLNKVLIDVEEEVLICTKDEYINFDSKKLKMSVTGDKIKNNQSLTDIQIIVDNIEVK